MAEFARVALDAPSLLKIKTRLRLLVTRVLPPDLSGGSFMAVQAGVALLARAKSLEAMAWGLRLAAAVTAADWQRGAELAVTVQ
jgi:hypothetical protein